MLRELYRRLCASFAEDKANKRWGKYILKWIAYITACACLGYVIGEVVELVLDYKEQIAMAIGSVICIGILYLGFSTKKEVPTEEKPQENDSILSFDENDLEHTYLKLQEDLFVPVSENADLLNVRKPTSTRQSEALTHYDIVGKVPVYHFMYAKAVENININDMFRLLEKIVEEKLDDREMDGFPPSFIYNGISYPSIMVHNVRDAGDYVQIDIVITSEEYLKHRTQRMYRRMMKQQKQTVMQDKDF